MDIIARRVCCVGERKILMCVRPLVGWSGFSFWTSKNGDTKAVTLKKRVTTPDLRSILGQRVITEILRSLTYPSGDHALQVSSSNGRRPFSNGRTDYDFVRPESRPESRHENHARRAILAFFSSIPAQISIASHLRTRLGQPNPLGARSRSDSRSL